MIDIILRATLTAAVAQGTPLLLTALGEIMNQRAGVLNLGLDGMMLFGAVTAFISLIASGSLFVAVLVGGVCAALLALIHAFLSITCRVHQVICGLALNIFALMFFNYFYLKTAVRKIKTIKQQYPDESRERILARIEAAGKPGIFYAIAFSFCTAIAMMLVFQLINNTLGISISVLKELVN
mgnify:CR=1 FL=1